LDIFLTNIAFLVHRTYNIGLRVKEPSINPPSNSNIALTSEGQGWQM